MILDISYVLDELMLLNLTKITHIYVFHDTYEDDLRN